MVKKIMVIVIALMTVFVLTACGTDLVLDELKNENRILKSENEILTERISELELELYKLSAKTELNDYVFALNKDAYTDENWATIKDIVAGGKTTIDAAKDKAEVDEALTDAIAAIDEVEVEVVSIHFYINENGVRWLDHKYYDFVNMTYSTKRILVEFDFGEPVIIVSEEEVVIATFTKQQLNTFFADIRENGFFDLEDYYYDEFASDGNIWVLIITFGDGTTFVSRGNKKYPEQKEAIDQAFLLLTGYKLFTSIWEDSNQN